MTADIDERIARAVKRPPPAGDPTYYWAADDRGMGDYVIGAFALFGPRAESLYLFYFVVLGASVMLFLADLGWHPLAAALLVFALAAIYTCTRVIPLGNLTVYASTQTSDSICTVLFVATVALLIVAQDAGPSSRGVWTWIAAGLTAGRSQRPHSSRFLIQPPSGAPARFPCAAPGLRS